MKRQVLDIMRLPRISGTTKMLLCALVAQARGDTITFRVRELAGDWGISHRQLRRCLEDLENEGLIVRNISRLPNGGNDGLIVRVVI